MAVIPADSGWQALRPGKGSVAHYRKQESLDSQVIDFPTHDFRILPRKGNFATEPVEVPLETGTYARGYKLATLRTLLDSAGLLTQVALSAIQVHDVALCRPLLEQAPVLRP